jgi:hypothetical protein
MRLVVADTSPLNYLVLIGQAEILPALRAAFRQSLQVQVAPILGAC